ncbi:MAG: glycosyltransferase [Candidatus Helarchaeota archaeon]
MKIAMLGTRGIPSNYSGFETCVEQLAKRLVIRGHQVNVYCRSHHINYDNTHYKGIKLIRHGTIQNKYLDTIVHTSLSSFHAIFQMYDIALYFNVGNSPVTWLPRIVGTKTILNVDGLDWKREKWPTLAKKYIKIAEFLSTKLPTAYLTDNPLISNYYKMKYNSTPPVIKYGSDVELLPPGETLKKFGLEKNKYILFVGRLVPEKRIEHLIYAFKKLDTKIKCVIVGDSPYSEEYKHSLRSIVQDDERIIFTGYVFGKGYHELGSNALLYVATSDVSGTAPALTEAMGFGNCVIVNNTPENLETIGDAGLSYDGKLGAESLYQVLDNLLSNIDIIEEYRRKAFDYAKRHYSWGVITDEYERLFYEVLNKPLPKRLIKNTKP